MLRRFLLAAGAAVLLGCFIPGCASKEPVVYSAAHNKRHALTLLDQSNELLVDMERIFFDMEEFPNESVGERTGRWGLAFLNGMHRFHMNMDRILFDMPEYPIETEY
ncbi:MAG TPA: hypothetical protein VMT52_00635 [Planctomycetota bacterium]|nr:hypothetical protein [Planctomycetota bacterium]